MYRADWGEYMVSERLRRQFWFSWEALTRLAFEFEFGEAYEEYIRTKYPTGDRRGRRAGRDTKAIKRFP
jgi:hypothetical protein